MQKGSQFFIVHSAAMLMSGSSIIIYEKIKSIAIPCMTLTLLAFAIISGVLVIVVVVFFVCFLYVCCVVLLLLNFNWVTLILILIYLGESQRNSTCSYT